MVRLPESLVVVPEFLELLNDLIVPADLLVDDEEQGIDREYCPEYYAKNFCFHCECLRVQKIRKRSNALGGVESHQTRDRRRTRRVLRFFASKNSDEFFSSSWFEDFPVENLLFLKVLTNLSDSDEPLGLRPRRVGIPRDAMTMYYLPPEFLR